MFRPTNADQIIRFNPRTREGCDRTPAERQAAILGKDFAEMGEMIDRREEHMIKELLFTGKVVVKGYID